MSPISQTVSKACLLERCALAPQRLASRPNALPSAPRVFAAGRAPARVVERRDVVVSASTMESSAEPSQGPPPMSASDLKAALLDSLFGLDRGLSAKGEAKAEMNELIGQLEAMNPTPSPTEASEMLSGNWKLVYTSNPQVLALLNLSNLPFVKIGDITQNIDGPGMTVENKIQISVPFSRTSFSTSASFEVSSPKRLRLQYVSGNVSTPELLEDIDLPNEVSILGQNVDLSQLKTALQPLNSTVKDAVAQLGNILSQQPDLKIPIEDERAPVTWLLTTYLDEDTRISRGDGGTVYVLVKDVSLDEPAEITGEVVEPSEPVAEVTEPVIEVTESVVEADAVVEPEPVEVVPEPAEETGSKASTKPKGGSKSQSGKKKI